jgi:hypothetical protein
MDSLIHIFWSKQPKIITKQQSHAFQETILKWITKSSQVYIDRTKGKPTLRNHPLEFSVSHTKNVWCMAIANTPIGIDIEHHQRQIPNKLFNRGQKNARPLKFNPMEAVIRWTQFEAEAKLKGTGIRFPMSAVTWPHLRTFSWQYHWVSVAHQNSFESVAIVDLTLAQNGSESLSDKLKSSVPSVLKWAPKSNNSIPSSVDLTNAHDPIAWPH